ncbi:MAG: class I SAM-dependent methyltransferase [Pseudooceanicola nanhaiensis]
MTLSQEQMHQALWQYYTEFDAREVLERFAAEGREATPGQIINFLGTRVEPAVFPPVLEAMAGSLEPLPLPGNWHADIAEWAAALHSVALASGTYRIVELGCGWGCWITNMGVAARRRGLEVDLVGIEGDAHHLANARRTLELNGFEPGQYRLNHGIAGPRPGRAIFPLNPDDGSNWGGSATFDPDPETLRAAEADPAVQVLDCMTLEQLGGGWQIDLLHIDIQGAETEFVTGNADQLRRFVKRVLIGTHSRQIEGDLCAHFLDAGWRLEMERPAVTPLRDGRPWTWIDGVQLWANPEISGSGETGT